MLVLDKVVKRQSLNLYCNLLLLFKIFVIIWHRCRTLDRCVWYGAVWNSAGWVFLGCFRPCTASPWRPTAPAPGARGWTGWRKGLRKSAAGGNPAHWAAHLDCCRPTGTSANWERNTNQNDWPGSQKPWSAGWHFSKDFSLFAQICVVQDSWQAKRPVQQFNNQYT